MSTNIDPRIKKFKERICYRIWIPLLLNIIIYSIFQELGTFKKPIPREASLFTD